MMFWASLTFSFDGEHFYTAHLAKQDRYTDKGKKLTNLRDILKQDRINYHLRQLKQANDEDDTYFAHTNSNKDLFERFDHAKIEIDNLLAEKIKSTEDLTICIIILTPKYISIHKDKCPDV